MLGPLTPHGRPGYKSWLLGSEQAEGRPHSASIFLCATLSCKEINLKRSPILTLLWNLMARMQQVLKERSAGSSGCAAAWLRTLSSGGDQDDSLPCKARCSSFLRSHSSVLQANKAGFQGQLLPSHISYNRQCCENFRRRREGSQGTLTHPDRELAFCTWPELLQRAWLLRDHSQQHPPLPPCPGLRSGWAGREGGLGLRGPRGFQRTNVITLSHLPA